MRPKGDTRRAQGPARGECRTRISKQSATRVSPLFSRGADTTDTKSASTPGPPRQALHGDASPSRVTQHGDGAMAPTGPNKRHGASGHAARKTHRVRRSLAWLGSARCQRSAAAARLQDWQRPARLGMASRLARISSLCPPSSSFLSRLHIPSPIPSLPDAPFEALRGICSSRVRGCRRGVVWPGISYPVPIRPAVVGSVEH